MANMTSQFIERVRQASPLERVMPELISGFGGFEVDGTARQKCRCPFHELDDLTFKIYPAEQFYRCWGCGCMGDVFDLIQGLQRVDFTPALDVLARRAGIQKPKLSEGDMKCELKRRAIEDVLGATADIYHRALVQDRAFLVDLQTKMAWSEETIREAKLGLARGAVLAGHLAAQGFDLKLAKGAGVVRRDGRAFFEGRLVIPYFARGRVVYMSGKALDGSSLPEYLDLPVSRLVQRVAFEADALHRQGKLIIVEGLASALTLKQWGYDVVSLAGTALSLEEVHLLRGHDRIYLSFDTGPFDRAVAGAKRIARQTGIVAYPVELPQGAKDPHEFAVKGHFRAEYEELLQRARPLLDVMMQRAASTRGVERAGHYRDLFTCMRGLSDPDIERYRDEAIDRLGINPEDFTAYLVAARTGERIPLEVATRDIPLGSFLELHPALDYSAEVGVLTAALDVTVGNRAVTRLYLITSNREKLELDGRPLKLHGKRLIFQSEPRAPYEKRWREADIERFRAGDNPDPGQTFSRLLEAVQRHIGFKEAAGAELLCVWCMGSYLFPLFGTYPYLHLYGPQGWARRQTMALASKVAFNMVPSSAIAPGDIFRLVQYSRCGLALDEVENLRASPRTEAQDLLRFLRAGYKEDGRAEVWEQEPGQGSHYRLRYAYSPKMVASTGPIEDILAGRCIPIDTEDWPGMRHELYCFALGHFKEVRQLYPDGAAANISLERDNELWLPLLAVAEFLEQRGADGLWERMIGYAVKACGSASEGLPQEFDVALIRALEFKLGRSPVQPSWVYASSIEMQVSADTGGRYSREQVAHRVGGRLRDLGFLSEPGSKEWTQRSVRYLIQPQDVRDARDRYGIRSVWF
jgi:DNA primase